MQLEEKRELVSLAEKKIFQDILRALIIALKNRIFYEADHPLCLSSIEQLRQKMMEWFKENETLKIDVAQKELFCNDASLGKMNTQYGELARHIHIRGILSIIFTDKLQSEDLSDLLKLIGQDANVIRQKGGILQCLPPFQGITIREIDYRHLLAGTDEEFTVNEEEIWESLFSIAHEDDENKLPTSKIDLVLNFFKDTKKSAQLLNKIYKYGLRHLNEEEVTWDYRQAIIRICEYLENVEDTEARSSRANIIQLLTHMHPDLVAALFEQATSDKKNTGLGKAIIDHFHDTEVAEFLSLLVAGEGCVNEFLVRIFDKLAPGEEEAKELTPLTADLLFSRNDMHPVNLSSLQQSVREIFRKHPHNSFINQMYKITVDSVLKKDLGGLTYLPNLAPEIHRFTQFMTSRVIREERVRLLVNLLWLEEDGNDYRRLSEKLLELLPDLIAAKQLEAIRTIYEFYFKKMPSKQEAVEEVRILVQKIHQRLSDDKLVTHLVQLIPEVPEGLPFFGGILKYVDDTAARILVDAYQNDTNKVHRERYVRVLPSLSSSILVELEAKLADRDPGNISLFVPILQQLHPDQAHATVKRLLNSRNSQVVYSVIDRFQPRDRDEIHDVYRIFIKTKDRVIKKKAAAVLLKTGEKETVGRVFAHAGEFRRRKLLFAVVQLCGELKSKQAFGLLVQILMKRSFLPSRKRDNLRLAAARSLMLIEWEKGYKIVSSRMKSGSRYFKDHCQKMIKQQLGQESKNGDRN